MLSFLEKRGMTLSASEDARGVEQGTDSAVQESSSMPLSQRRPRSMEHEGRIEDIAKRAELKQNGNPADRAHRSACILSDIWSSVGLSKKQQTPATHVVQHTPRCFDNTRPEERLDPDRVACVSTKCDLTQSEEERGTYLYLAYGSNLCHETFQGNRGIKPLSQVNVVVPELRLTFDLPGVPYSEPCFANTARRTPPELFSEKRTISPLGAPPSTRDYHKDRWKKGLVGVVYEVTPSDYAHIIATEGGGSSYHDILVSCYAISTTEPVPEHPITTSFKAHTLFSPAEPGPKQVQASKKATTRGRFQRSDPSYAQPSARYLKLITDGADEHSLPQDYKDYLHDIRPYTMTTQGQRIGQFIFLSIWGPFIMLLFGLMRMYGDPKTGKAPKWLMEISGAIFASVWISYDDIFKGIFGDGERTNGEEEMESEWSRRRELVEKAA